MKAKEKISESASCLLESKEKPNTPMREEQEVKRKFPNSIFFIIGNEFCERFCFYGMKAILPIYLTAWLGYTEDRSTTIIHSFNFACYFFTLFGGIISDSYWGKFKTILILSLVYCVGSIVLAVTSFPALSGNPPKSWGAFIGLSLLAVGTGGIKPCVSSFGGDQFHSSQVKQIATFFSIFYFSINAGSVLSMFITPILRSNVHCYGQNSCYPLAFGLPAILMILATAIFIFGYKFYIKRPTHGNLVTKLYKVVGLSLKRKVIHRKNYRNVKFLNAAEPDYSNNFIQDVRRLFSVLLVFLPICLFWALYDQQGSRWTFQALLMNPKVRLFGQTFNIKAEQMGIINAVLILILIPIFDRVVYPAFGCVGIKCRPLVRIFWGMVLGVISFIMAGILQFAITARGTFIPNPTDPMTDMCIAGCVHILAQVPQYIVLTCGEIMLSITGLELAYSQAPATMKSVCQAAWLLTVAAGNLIVIFFNEVDFVRMFTQKNVNAWNFVMWAGILTIGTLLFALLAWSYEYVEDKEPHLMPIDNEDKTIVKCEKEALLPSDD